jgi:hypothetical protein
MERGRDNIVIGLMVIFTYFLIYTLFENSSMLQSLGGLPMIECTTSLIREGFSFATLNTLTQDFAQTIIVVYIVVFVQNLLPIGGRRTVSGIIGLIVGYIVLYLIGMWVVRYIVFTNVMNEIIRTFVSILSVVIAGVGAIFVSPLRRLITRRAMNEYVRNYFLDSRPVHWLADSFFISAVILFIAVALEITVGLPVFFTVFLAGIPAIITMICMIVGLYFIIRI